jgi:hypothetical protein
LRLTPNGSAASVVYLVEDDHERQAHPNVGDRILFDK